MLIDFQYLAVENVTLGDLKEWKKENGVGELGPGFVDRETGQVALVVKVKGKGGGETTFGKRAIEPM
jgi:hypothetical protein